MAYLFLGETVTTFQFIGGLITLLGMLMYFWRQSIQYAASKRLSY
ncbi:hypothetical protein [Paenibacillus sp. DCT19]|nr:hypothetical protein [Paenibacillus sp. DCT19]